jgi:WhiB family redox-sensing transcriptional regulator
MAGRYGTSATATLPVGLNGHPLARIARPQPWKARAACGGVDPALFYPDWPPNAEARRQAQSAKAICAGCDVRLECLVFALSTGEELGIWGGTNQYERRALRRLIVKAHRIDKAKEKVA